MSPDAITIALLVLVLLVVAFAVAAFFFLRQHYFHDRYLLPRIKSWVFLEILVPQDTGQQEPQKTTVTPEEKKNLIALGEQLLLTISDLGGDKSWYAPGHHLTLEIACVDKKISFFLNCPKEFVEVIEKQIHAQFPHAFIEQRKIYNPFAGTKFLAATELKLKKEQIFPLKTYRSMDTDPLNALTNSMSKLVEGEGAAVQLVLAPAGSSWQKRPGKVALEIQQGKAPEEVLKSGFSKVLGSAAKETGKIFKSEKSKTPEEARKDLSGDKAPIQLTPMQQELVKRLEEKASRPGYEVNIRLVTASSTQAQADGHLQNLMAAFLQYNQPPFNELKKASRKTGDVVKDYIFRVYRASSAFVLNTEELASMWHLPNQYTETPNINWLHSRKAPAPIDIPTEGVLLGKNIYRGQETEIRQLPEDRLRHTYIIGRSGTGKTNIMKYMALQDIQNGGGLCIVDPHGDFIEDVLPHVPKERAEDVVLFEPFDLERPMGLNMLDVSGPEQQDFAVQEMIGIFYKLVTDPAMLGPMFEHYMRNAMLTLMADMDHPGTLVEIPRIFTDKDFQDYKVKRVSDPLLRAFWEKEMSKTDFAKGGGEMLGYLISKVGRFIENQMMRNIVGQPKSAFDFRKIMDEGKILLVNLSKGKVGEINAKLLGLILVSKIQMAALSRADQHEDQRRDFFLYVDEFQNFITDAFSTILSEARKYHLGLVIAHQYLSQLQSGAGVQGAGSSDLRDAVFGNAGTMVAFRIGVEDAETMAKEFAPTFSAFDLLNVDRFNAFVKLLIRNRASKPFNMATFPLPKATPEMHSLAESIRQLSRLKYGRARGEVEAQVLEASQVAESTASKEDRFSML